MKLDEQARQEAADKVAQLMDRNYIFDGDYDFASDVISAYLTALGDKPVAWQSIETAPKNRAILIHVPHLDYYGNDGVYAGMLVDMGTGPHWMTFGWAIGRDLGLENVPDAWAPMPAFASPQPVAVSEELPVPLAVSAEVQAKVEADRKELATKVDAHWRDGLSHKDWLFDGSPIRGRVMIERFNSLDWESAWIDLGPSIAGNLGPYWHVPLKETIIDGEVYDEGDTVHRLYPKVLQSKWALLILQACNEAEARGRRAALAADGRKG